MGAKPAEYKKERQRAAFQTAKVGSIRRTLLNIKAGSDRSPEEKIYRSFFFLAFSLFSVSPCGLVAKPLGPVFWLGHYLTYCALGLRR